MFTRHNRTVRYTVPRCKTGPPRWERTSYRTQPFRAYRPPETRLKAALRRLIANYTAIRNARRLPCQILWDFLFRRRSDSQNEIRGTSHQFSTATTYLSGTYPKDTEGIGLYKAKSREVQVQEDGRLRELENAEKPMENIEEVESAEKRVGDVESLEKESRKDVKKVNDCKKSKDWDEQVGYGSGGAEDGIEDDIGEDVEEDVEDVEEDAEEDIGEEVEENVEDVEEDFEEDIEEHVKEDVEEDVKEEIKEDVEEHFEDDTDEDIGQDFKEMKGRRCGKTRSRFRSDGKDFEDKTSEVRVDNSDHTGPTYLNGLANITKAIQDREARTAISERKEPPMGEATQTKPIQTVPTGLRTTTTQAMLTLEEIKTSLFQLPTLANHRPRKTALGTRNFITYVLNPRGIQINTEEAKVESAFEHFQSVEPLPRSNVYKHYTQLSGLRSSTLWINPTDDVVQSIHSNYSEMHQSVPNALCEPEWVDDAVKFLLKSEPRSKLQPKLGSNSQWLPVRMREESFRPQDGGVWDIPPIVHRDIPVDPTFSFNVQPDCSYWIWTGGFRPEINGKLISLTSVRFRRSLCPYLTIEVKKDTKNSSKGRQQIAVAASTALYNRWRLRESYLRKAGVSFGRERFSDVRHYGLLLAGVRYEIWCLRPNNTANISHFSTQSWTGCGMQKIHSGDLDTNAGIRDCINWINEIHCWGNTRHSSGCARDIESRLLPQEKTLATTTAQLALVKKDFLHV